MWADNASNIDMLAYKPYAELIYEISNDKRMSPLTIGLFGSWGSGKSTLLRLINEKVIENNKENKEVIAITLNSWMFEGYDDAKTALMESLLRAIESSEDIDGGCKKGFKKLIKRVNLIRIGRTIVKQGIPLALSALTGNPVPAITSIGLGITEKLKSSEGIEELADSAKKMKEEYLKEDDKDESIVENIRVFRGEFQAILKDSGIENLIIMIDDLDRCNPDRILETLEAIKLFLAVEKTTFIVAIDERVVTYAIKKKYPKLSAEDNIDVSKDYIEKIIQLPIRLPELSEMDIKNYMLMLVCEMFLKIEEVNGFLDKLSINGLISKGGIINSSDILSSLNINMENAETKLNDITKLDEFKEQLLIFETIGDVIAGSLKGNPRQAKRFLNTFHIRKRMAEIQGFKPNLAVLAKLMVLEEVDKELFNELYVWQSQNEGKPDKLKEVYNLVKGGKELKDTSYSKWNQDRIKKWIDVEPIDLYDIDLRQYFYLSRESIGEISFVKNNLTYEERKSVNDICLIEDKTFQRKLIVGLKARGLPEESLDKIFKAIFQKFRQNHGLVEALVNVYINFEKYRDVIIKELMGLSSADITASTLKLLASLKKKDEQRINNFKSELINQGLLEGKKLEMWNKFEGGNS
ncbi:KAP family P-loop NTPase fold protein [Clostridium tagluense]|uniref:KAP family P-loop NTPase fold protein n=1 Tax=Clostridium tagluense TaxID=360422 RepID=UPI001CF33798|nr:P-loop NTPase fold protein [Clostridium tagluense]MCB2299857.1 KAP family NTPase [Clostridium tagluense]